MGKEIVWRMIVEWIVSIILILIFLFLCAFAFMTVAVVLFSPLGKSPSKEGFVFINDDGDEELGEEHAGLLAKSTEQEEEALFF